MADILKLNDKEYDLTELSDIGRQQLDLLRSIDLTILEKKNLLAVLVRAKRSYIAEIKSEMLSKKAGFDFSG